MALEYFKCFFTSVSSKDKISLNNHLLYDIIYPRITLWPYCNDLVLTDFLRTEDEIEDDEHSYPNLDPNEDSQREQTVERQIQVRILS